MSICFSFGNIIFSIKQLSIPLSPSPMNITIPVVIGTIPCLKGSACAFTMDLKGNIDILGLGKAGHLLYITQAPLASSNIEGAQIGRPCMHSL